MATDRTGVQFTLPSLSLSVINEEIKRLRKAWVAMPKVTVVNSVSELPFEAPANADGAYSEGHVYVVAGNIFDLKQLQKVMAHECVLHHSLEEMLGNYGFAKLHNGIQGLKKRGDPVVTRLADDILARYGVLAPECETREIVARAGEQCLDESGNVKVQFGFMKSVFAGVAGWLRDHGLGIPFSNLELQGIMHDAGEWVKRDGPEQGQGLRAGARGGLDGGMGVAHSFAGVRAEGAPFDDADRWFEGVDGKRRFEIGDADARLTMNNLGKADWADLANGDSAGIELGRLLDHPELFAAYPDLETVWVVIDPNNEGASYRRNNRVIRVEYDKETREVSLSSLLHEIQHAIQDIEGFARGGSPNAFKDQDVTDKELSRINQQVHELYAQNPAFYRDAVKATQLRVAVKDKFGSSDFEMNEPLVQEWWAAIEKRDLHPESKAYISLKSMECYVSRDRVILLAQDQYHRLAGEVEARLTQARKDMSIEERLVVYPIDQMDVAVKDQMVRFGERNRLKVVTEGTFNGKVVDVAEGMVTQKVGRDPEQTVRHDVGKLSAGVAKGDVVEIRYEGGVGVVSGRGEEVGVAR